MSDLLPYVDVFLPNAKELQMLTGYNTIEEGLHELTSFANSIVVKNGSKGALAWDGKTIVSQPAFLNEQVVDSIGAGDSFNAGFVREFIDHKPFKKCLEFAALMGAINTTSAGGTVLLNILKGSGKLLLTSSIIRTNPCISGKSYFN